MDSSHNAYHALDTSTVLQAHTDTKLIAQVMIILKSLKGLDQTNYSILGNGTEQSHLVTDEALELHKILSILWVLTYELRYKKSLLVLCYPTLYSSIQYALGYIYSHKIE